MSVFLQGLSRAVNVGVCPGGPAGTHLLDGHMPASGCTLISVRQVSADLGTNTDRTSEFTITALNTIRNLGGTDTTGYFLVVTYAAAASY